MPQSMAERCILSQGKDPVKRIKGLSEERQCLKFPGYECNCQMSDTELRKSTLRRLRQELGAYSFINLLDTGVAETYEVKRKQLCEGEPPKLIQRIKDLLTIRIV